VPSKVVVLRMCSQLLLVRLLTGAKLNAAPLVKWILPISEHRAPPGLCRLQVDPGALDCAHDRGPWMPTISEVHGIRFV
jgi:hypothetical protein